MAEQTPLGAFAWHEIASKDAKSTREFYTKLMGWKTKEMEMGGGFKYTMFTDGKQDLAGIMPMDGPQWKGVAPHWVVYLTVKDVDASARKVKSLGGKVVVEPTDIPNIGRFSIIVDPAGASVALFQGA
jgi:hypothetical protein